MQKLRAGVTPNTPSGTEARTRMLTLPVLIVSAVLGGGPAVGADLENAVLDFSATWCGPCQQVSPLVAKLARAGLPIHKIDVDQNQALAARYGVSSIPAFLVVINGKVVERQVGVQSEQALREMCRKVTQARAAQAPSAKPVGRGQSAAETPAAPALIGQPFPATVRIRVKDPSGDDVGTGTIIHNADGRSLVLTCGHLFKNWDEKKSRLQVEVFEKGTGRVILGRKLAADLEADVALISIPSDQPLPCCTLATRGTRPTKGAPLISVGCSGGAPPTLERHKVVALNRYTGPDNLECTGIPVRGRSGGGLFTPAGEVVGVCMAEDPNYKDGMYAGLEPIYRLLDRLRLTSLFQTGVPEEVLAADDTEIRSPAESELRTAQIEQPARETLAVEMPADDPTSLGVDQPLENSTPTADSSLAADGTRSDPQLLLRRALKQSKAGDIVCVIPGRSGAPGDATVVVIHDPSDELRRTLSAGPGERLPPPARLAGLPPEDIRRQMREAESLDSSGDRPEATQPTAVDWGDEEPRPRARAASVRGEDTGANERNADASFRPVSRAQGRDRGLDSSDTERRSSSAVRSGGIPRDSSQDELGESEGAMPVRHSGGTFRRGRPMSLRPVTTEE